mgnify:CR=1 FL=1
MKVKISDLYDVSSSKRVFQSEWRNSGVPFYRAREIAKLASDGYVDNELFIDENLYSEYVERYGKPQPGDIIITGVGTLGVCYVVKPEDRFYFKDGNILWFRQKAPDQIKSEYLVRAFDSKDVKDFIVRNSSGTTVGTFTIQTANKLEINLPPINEQEEVIDKLSRIEEIIKKREEELQLLDTLIKARFIEMFGEPISNTKKLSLQKLGDICELKAGDFTIATDIHEKQDKDNPYPCYGGNGIRGYVNNYTHDGDYPIIGRQGALCGNIQYAIGKFRNTEHAILVTPKIEINKIWLYELLILENLNRYQTGAAQPGLAVKTLNIIKIPIADIMLQNDFAAFVSQVDKSKVAVQKALDEAQLLFDSLMQEYFG